MDETITNFVMREGRKPIRNKKKLDRRGKNVYNEVRKRQDLTVAPRKTNYKITALTLTSEAVILLL